MAGQVQPLPGLAESAEGLQELVPFGRGEVYTYPTSGHGDIIIAEGDVPSRFGEADFLAFRNEQVHPRYGDRLIVRRLDKLPFGLVRHTPQNPLEDITRRCIRTMSNDLRANHLALRLDGTVPGLPETPQVGILDAEGVIEFWGGIINQLRADFENRQSLVA